MTSHITDWQREDYRSFERRVNAWNEQQIALAVRDLETDRLMRKAFKAKAEEEANGQAQGNVDPT